MSQNFTPDDAAKNSYPFFSNPKEGFLPEKADNHLSNHAPNYLLVNLSSKTGEIKPLYTQPGHWEWLTIDESLQRYFTENHYFLFHRIARSYQGSKLNVLLPTMKQGVPKPEGISLCDIVPTLSSIDVAQKLCLERQLISCARVRRLWRSSNPKMVLCTE